MLKCATDLLTTIVVLPDCTDRRNLVIAGEAKQSRADRAARESAALVCKPIATAEVWMRSRSKSQRIYDPVLDDGKAGRGEAASRRPGQAPGRARSRRVRDRLSRACGTRGRS